MKAARIRLGLLAALAAATAGCGQQGPLVLPDAARPIERVGPPATPAEPDDDDDERTRER